MSNTQYDPRYPFGKPEQAKPVNGMPESEAQSGGQFNAKAQPQSYGTRQSKWSVWRTLGILGALGAMGYCGVQLLDEEKAVEPEPEPVQVQPAEPVLHCPVYKKGEANPTLEECKGYAHVTSGMVTHVSFPDRLRQAVVRETLAGLESGMKKSDALGHAETELFNGITNVHNTRVFMRDGARRIVGEGLTRLESNFPTPIAVQSRDVPHILKSVSYCLEHLKANLDGYTNQEAKLMLETFGSVMMHPDLAKEALQEVGKNKEWAVEAQKQMFRETTNGLQIGLSPHEAACQAVSVVFDNPKTPMAFYAYAQTAKEMQGKTKTQIFNAFGANMQELNKNPEGWFSRNNKWLLGMCVSGAFVCMLGVKGLEK